MAGREGPLRLKKKPQGSFANDLHEFVDTRAVSPGLDELLEPDFEGLQVTTTRKALSPLCIKPIEPIDYKPALPSPVAVFEQKSRGSTHNAEFVFAGWYRVANIALLAPESEALVHMLEQKWTPRRTKRGTVKKRERDEASWRASLAVEWAVIRFEPVDGEAANGLEPPKIARVKKPEEKATAPRKSVNELLAELRQGDCKDVADSDKSHPGKD